MLYDVTLAVHLMLSNELKRMIQTRLLSVLIKFQSKKKLSLILQHVHCTANKQPPILQEIKVTINHLSIFSLVCSIQFIVILVPVLVLVLVLVPNNTLYETQLRGKIPLIAIIKFQIISQFE